MKIIYFNEKIKKIIYFNDNNITEENFYDDILNICSTSKNGFTPIELIEKLNDFELSTLLSDLEFNKEEIKKQFFKAYDTMKYGYLNLFNQDIIKVLELGNNNECTILSDENTKGVFISSNLYLNQNICYTFRSI
jgi:hypothetical protein